MTRKEALAIAKPILFNTDMVSAILGGGKTVTRRVIKPRYKKNERGFFTATIAGTLFLCYSDEEGEETRRVKAAYQVGDLLYVREAWNCLPIPEPLRGTSKTYWYKADGAEAGDKWRPSIHMPKEAARLFLRVTSVRAEQLQDIITGDYKTPLNINREGLILPCSRCTHHNGDCKNFIAQKSCRLVDEYVKLWNGTVPKSDLYKYGWAVNPPVLVVTFKRVEVSK